MYNLDILVCNSSGVLNIIYICKTIMNLFKIVVPLLLIILVIIDLSKIVTGKEDSHPKIKKKIIDRFLSAVLVFFVFDLVSFAVNFTTGTNITDTNCFKKANKESIAQIKKQEEKIRKQKEEEIKKSKETREKQSKEQIEKALQEYKTLTQSLSPGNIKGNGKFIWPAPGTTIITSGVGPRWGAQHQGIDISSGNAYGMPIVAADAGVVINAETAGWGGGYGLNVVIDHGNGYFTRYGHASKVLVRVGQKVSKGDKIAEIGSTGDSTGPHLHFEIRKGNEWGPILDPENFVKPS